MSLQYLSNEEGQIIAVQVPIKEWELLKIRYPDLDAASIVLPDWQKELIDSRLKAISENPGRIFPIDSLISELDSMQE